MQIRAQKVTTLMACLFSPLAISRGWGKKSSQPWRVGCTFCLWASMEEGRGAYIYNTKPGLWAVVHRSNSTREYLHWSSWGSSTKTQPHWNCSPNVRTQQRLWVLCYCSSTDRGDSPGIDRFLAAKSIICYFWQCRESVLLYNTADNKVQT